MTEKVVSLSGGLVLGMAFALFLGISTTQTMTSPLHLEYPSVSSLIGLNDLQSYRSSSSSQASDTTPSFSVAPPTQEQDRGRIVRIATVTETAEPLLQPSTYTAGAVNVIPKNQGLTGVPENQNTLQQMHRQHSYIAAASGTNSYTAAGQIARQTGNFTSIADNGQGTGQASGNSGGQPPVIDGKPQTTGSPAIAQNDPGAGEGEGEEQDPALAGFPPRPPDPDSMSENNTRETVDPYSPEWHHDFHETQEGSQGGHNPDPHGGSQFQQGHRPEVD